MLEGQEAGKLDSFQAFQPSSFHASRLSSQFWDPINSINQFTSQLIFTFRLFPLGAALLQWPLKDLITDSYRFFGTGYMLVLMVYHFVETICLLFSWTWNWQRFGAMVKNYFVSDDFFQFFHSFCFHLCYNIIIPEYHLCLVHSLNCSNRFRYFWHRSSFSIY